VQLHLRYGMILFIASEVMFFVGLVLGLLRFRAVSRPRRSVSSRVHRRLLAAQGHRGLRSLAPAAAQHADPADCSGTTVTWAHHALLMATARA
jgi:cytochrome c oxidase subunit 3